MKLKKILKTTLILLGLLLCTFSLNANYFDDIYPETVSQEDVTFYEIHPCEVSLFEFLLKNPKSIYQNHYKFTPYEYSSIECFGRISGLTIIDNYKFYISVGLNGIVNLIVQSILWGFLLKFFLNIEKNSTQNISNKIKLISTVTTSVLVTQLMSSDSRYYEKTLNLIDISSNRGKIYFFVMFFIIISYFQNHLLNNSSYLINYFPWLYVLSFIYQGFNINLISIFLIFYGMVFVLSEKKIKIFIIPIFYSIIYILNFKDIEKYYFDPDKLRGFINLTYSLENIILSSFQLFIIFLGLIYILKNSFSKLELPKLINNLCLSSMTILLLGIIGSQFPFFNFLNFYLFGHNKRGTTENNLLLYDIFSNKVAWRGLFPSAETIGEFFGITLLFLIYFYFKNRKFSKLMLSGFFVSSAGLYLSNNRSVLVLVSISLIYFLLEFKNFNSRKFYLIFIILSGLIFYFFALDNTGYAFQYTSTVLLEKSELYSIPENTSSAFKYLQENTLEKGIFSFFISSISLIAYLINRSELWGIFIARYEVDFMEFLFGTGPYNLSRHYSLIKIKPLEGLLLPHSSLLSLLVFFGLVGIILLILLLFTRIFKRRKTIGNFNKYIIFYLLANLFKSDSFLYHQSLFFYIFLFYVTTEGILNFQKKKSTEVKY